MLEIPASAIEAAAGALMVEIGGAAASLLAAERGREKDLSGEFAEAALRAAFDELGMEQEIRGTRPGIIQFRSRWMPVEKRPGRCVEHL